MFFVPSVISAYEGLWVDRDDKKSRGSVREAIYERAHDDRFPPLIIFHEGNRSNNTGLGEFQLGAFRPGVCIQPIFIQYECDGFNPATVRSGSQTIMVCLRCLCNVGHKQIITYLDPYYPSEEEKKDPILFRDNVRKLYSKVTGVPETLYSYRDYQLIGAGLKNKCKFTEQFSIEYEAIKKVFPYTVEDLIEMIKVYAKIGGRSRGRILLKDFIEYIKTISPLLNEKEIENLFYMLDEEEHGYLEFRQFLFGCASVDYRMEYLDNYIDMLYRTIDGKTNDMFNRLNIKYNKITNYNDFKMYVTSHLDEFKEFINFK